MPRSTSAAAFRQLIDSGRLSERREQVLTTLWEHGPLTGAELDAYATTGRGHWHKRLPELRDRGLAAEVGTRVCRVTGEEVIVWDAVLSATPQPLPRALKPRVRFQTAAEQFVLAVEANERRGSPGVPRAAFEALRQAYRDWKGR